MLQSFVCAAFAAGNTTAPPQAISEPASIEYHPNLYPTPKPPANVSLNVGVNSAHGDCLTESTIQAWGDPGYGGSVVCEGATNFCSPFRADCTANEASLNFGTNGLTGCNGAAYGNGNPVQEYCENTQPGTNQWSWWEECCEWHTTPDECKLTPHPPCTPLNGPGAVCGDGACAAWTFDGNLVSWGDSPIGGDSSAVTLTGVIGAHCGNQSCVAWTSDGNLEAWGNSQSGGSAPTITGAVGAHCGAHACVAWRSDGTLQAWGQSAWGGNSGGVTLTGVVEANCGGNACVARSSSGNIEAWGHIDAGGSAPAITGFVVGAHCGYYACVAWTSDGNFKAWGHASYGGSAPTITGVVGAHCGNNACVAWTSGGTLKAWGDTDYGGAAPPSGVTVTGFVVGAHCGSHVCVAWTSDGSADAWGHGGRGGQGPATPLEHVIGAHCGKHACVAWTSDGTAEAWGVAHWGGNSGGVTLTGVGGAHCGAFACVAWDRAAPPDSDSAPMKPVIIFGIVAAALLGIWAAVIGWLFWTTQTWQLAWFVPQSLKDYFGKMTPGAFSKQATTPFL